MANTTIALKKSGTSSSKPSSLANGEIAINYADGVIYYKHANGNIASISTGSFNYFGTVDANGTLLVSDTTADVVSIYSGDGISIVGDAVNDRMYINATPIGASANGWANTLYTSALQNANNDANSANIYAMVYANGVANSANAYALSISGSGGVNVSTTGPTGNTNGSLWWNTDLGRLFIWYTDGDSNQWVEASPSSGSVDVGLLQSYVNAANIYATTLITQGLVAGNAWSNTKLSNTSGVTFAGSLFIPNGSTLGIGSSETAAPLTISLNNTVSVALSGVIIDTDGSSNTFLQNHIRNANTGINASSDWIATTDDGTDTTNFIDLGINGSGFTSPNWTINGGRDGYLYTVDSNLSIGSANSTSRTKFVNFFVGGTLSSNEVMRIQDSTGGANVGIGTTTPSSKLQVNGVIQDSKGDVRDIPLNPQTLNYGITVADTGKIVSANAGIFVPNTVFTSGQTVMVYNNTAASITITPNSSVTMFLAGTSNTSVRNLSQRGLATIVCVLANTFVISGAGLS